MLIHTTVIPRLSKRLPKRWQLTKSTFRKSTFRKSTFRKSTFRKSGAKSVATVSVATVSVVTDFWIPCIHPIKVTDFWIPVYTQLKWPTFEYWVTFKYCVFNYNIFYYTTYNTIYNQGIEIGLTRETTERRNRSQSI